MKPIHLERRCKVYEEILLVVMAAAMANDFLVSQPPW